MAKYRKRPVVIEAIQNDGTWPPIIAWLRSFVDQTGMIFQPGSEPPITHNPADGSLRINTLEGTMRAEFGDWIIRGVKNELYPCKPDIFAATYEPVERKP